MNLSYVQSYATTIIVAINSYIVPVLFAIAFLYFIYGIYKYFIYGAADDTSRANGRQFILWGLIGFAVIVSIWGLVALAGNILGLTPGGSVPAYPTL